MSEQAVGSRVLLRVPNIKAFAPGDVDQNPTTLPVDMALVPVGTDPVAADWLPAAWNAAAVTPTAELLVGPGGAIAPAKGVYEVYVRVRGVQQQPAEPVGKHVVK